MSSDPASSTCMCIYSVVQDHKVGYRGCSPHPIRRSSILVRRDTIFAPPRPHPHTSCATPSPRHRHHDGPTTLVYNDNMADMHAAPAAPPPLPADRLFALDARTIVGTSHHLPPLPAAQLTFPPKSLAAPVSSASKSARPCSSTAQTSPYSTCRPTHRPKPGVSLYRQHQPHPKLTPAPPQPTCSPPQQPTPAS